MATIGFTNGCFDILHLGHLRYLKEASLRCDKLIVGLNSDKSVTRLKGAGRPVNSEQNRKEFLEFLTFVDEVIIFEEDTPLNLIRLIVPDVIFKGGDYVVEDIVGNEFVTSLGGRVEIIEFHEGFSTTKIINDARCIS